MGKERRETDSGAKMMKDDMRWEGGREKEKGKRVPSPLAERFRAGEESDDLLERHISIRTFGSALHKPKLGQDEGEMTKKVTTVSARKLRRNFTEAEMKLWKHLRNRLISGQKFRRQQPIGKYIVDFVCFEKGLIVEVDGGQHGERAAYDSERTAWLESQGFRVLRFWNNEVLRDVEIVLDLIVKELKERGSLSPSP